MLTFDSYKHEMKDQINASILNMPFYFLHNKHITAEIIFTVNK